MSEQTAALPPSLAVSPNIPHSEQTLEQLYAEREYWERQVSTAPGFASAKAADDFRHACQVWINKRKAEGRQASNPLDIAARLEATAQDDHKRGCDG